MDYYKLRSRHCQIVSSLEALRKNSTPLLESLLEDYQKASLLKIIEESKEPFTVREFISVVNDCFCNEDISLILSTIKDCDLEVLLEDCAKELEPLEIGDWGFSANHWKRHHLQILRKLILDQQNKRSQPG